MIKLATITAIDDKVIISNSFSAGFTFNRFFTRSACIAEPIIAVAFSRVKFPGIYIAATNVEIFFAKKTRNIPKMYRNSFLAIDIGTKKRVHIQIRNIMRMKKIVDDYKTLPKKNTNGNRRKQQSDTGKQTVQILPLSTQKVS